jgi:proteic killer suppression protein
VVPVTTEIDERTFVYLVNPRREAQAAPRPPAPAPQAGSRDKSVDEIDVLCVLHNRQRLRTLGSAEAYMEMEYGDDATRRLHQEGISYGKGFDRQALIRLNRIKAAVDQRDLAALRGNRFEKLKGDRAGYYSIRINDQWRITFRIEDDQALDVTIEDYH